MQKTHINYYITSILLLILSDTFIKDQTNDQANLKATPLIMQTKPQRNPQQAQAEQFVRSLPADRQKTFRAVSNIMAKQLIENMKSNKSDRIKEEGASQILIAAMDKIAIITNATDPNTLIQNTMYASISGFEDEIKQMTTQLSGNSYVQTVLREEIAFLKDILASWPEETVVQAVTYRSCVKLTKGGYEIDKKTVVMSKEQTESLLDDMENQLATMTDMSQGLQFDLQDAMNKQQQAMQLISNIMKNMHDTAKSIIQNLR